VVQLQRAAAAAAAAVRTAGARALRSRRTKPVHRDDLQLYVPYSIRT
jgi:hypothetical protein